MENGEILTLYDDLKTYYTEMHGRFRRVYDLVNLNYDINVPEGYRAYKPPTPKSKLDTVVGQLQPKEFKIKVVPLKVTDVEKDRAKNLEALHYHNLTRIEASMNTSIIGKSFKHVLQYGMAVKKGPFYDAMHQLILPTKKPRGTSDGEWSDLLERWAIQQKTECPYIVSLVHPLNIYPDPIVFGEKQPKPRFMMEAYKRKAIDIEQALYGVGKKNGWEWRIPDTRHDFSDLEYMEYWDIDICKIFVDGKYAGSFPNMYGYIPYEIAFSGFGDDSPDGKPEDKAIGILWPIRDALELEGQGLTTEAVAMQLYGIMPMWIPEEYHGMKVDMKPGALNATVVKPEPLMEMHKEVGDVVQVVLARAREYAEEGTFGQVIGGQKLAGVSSGIFEQLLVSQAKKRFAPVIKALQDSWSKVTAKCAKIVEKIIEKSPINDIKVGDIKGYYYNTVNFETSEQIELKFNVDMRNAMKGQVSMATMNELWPVGQIPKGDFNVMREEMIALDPASIQAEAQKRAQGGQPIEKENMFKVKKPPFMQGAE